MNKDEARAALRVADKLYRRDTAKADESTFNRERTAYLASEAGISDIEISKWYGIPRETARRMRVKHQEKMGVGTPEPVVMRRPGGITRFPKFLADHSQERERVE